MVKMHKATLAFGAFALSTIMAAATAMPASALVNIWNGTDYAGKGGALPRSVADYRAYTWSDGTGSMDNKAESYYNDTAYKIWFWDAYNWSGSAQGWSNPGGNGNFGASLANKLSSHRP